MNPRFDYLTISKRADDAYDITDGRRRVAKVRRSGNNLTSFEWRVGSGEAGMLFEHSYWEKKSRAFKTHTAAISAFFARELK